MNESLLFWAKLGDNVWPTEYHPVVCHLIDVGQVAHRLWDDVFRKHIKQWVTGRFGLPDENTTGAWLAFWVAAHDIGKVSPCFQDRGERTNELRMRLEPGFNFGTIDKPHGDISTKVLAEELKQRNGQPWIPKAIARNIAVAVGGHHGIFPTDWVDMSRPLGNQSWSSARRELLSHLARLFGVNDLQVPNPPNPDDQSVWIYLAGLTSVADWIGSNVEFFKPVGNADLAAGSFDVDGYFRNAERYAEESLKTLGWLGRANDNRKVSMSDFLPRDREARPLQKTVAEIVEGMTDPGLLIVEAPMGEGKTEAAWFAAASWDKCDGQGTYVALPTMATSNQMFGRVESFLGADGEGKKNLMLQHGKATLNDKFDDLKYKARVYDEEKRPSAVVAEEWFAANKKHGLLAPYGVGTIDQALLAVLQTKHMFVRLFGLAGKCVILDEVHAYDAYMTTLMERLLRWLAALQCTVVLLSATLPKDKRLALLRAYAGDDVQEPEPVSYPRVTSVTVGGPPTATPVQADPKRAKTVKLGWIMEDGLIERLKSALANGGCAAVIRNTVGLAQETYERLRDGLKEAGITVELFHARFPFGRRKQIEDNVLGKLGKGPDGAATNTMRPARYVLVATQVIEQSLDLDFDLMISDLAPVDLVLQRAGRLHRHERGERQPGLTEPYLWLIEPEFGEDGVPRFGKSEYVYARYVLLKSRIVLKSAGSIRLPDDLERFVEQVYGTETLTIPDGWNAALKESEAKLTQERREHRMKAKGVMIYRPDDEDLLGQQNAQLDEDNPEAAEKIRAATRDTEPTIQLIVVYHLYGQDFLDAGRREPFDETDEPNLVRVRRMLDNEVSIGHRGCVMHYVRSPVPPGWRKSGMLRNHRILRVDPEGLSLTDDWIRITHNLGVIITRKTDRGVGRCQVSI
jgi:CRISPR-associated endonuclease/helicase Cas3